jgi:2-polyprenyl-3-methyl-5-hydroxy-6-metoxy-1,4-benzoquinol methylase
MELHYRERIYAEYATNFQDAADIFDIEGSRRWGSAYRAYLHGWLPENKHADIVDLACGSGKLLHLFQLEGYRRISGVDISPDQISRARQVTEDVVLGDAIDFLEKRRERFDLIVGLDIVEHFHKPEVIRFLDCCHNALKPGGRLILQTPNAESPWGSTHRYNDLTHEVCFNPNALSRLLRLTGFSDIEARETGPLCRGGSLVSMARYSLWRVIHACLTLWNLVETGSRGSGVFTRVFLISGLKQ